MTGQFFVPSRGPMPPEHVVTLEFTDTETRCQPVDASGAAVGEPYWRDGRPSGWRFATAAEAHRFIESKRSEGLQLHYMTCRAK